MCTIATIIIFFCAAQAWNKHVLQVEWESSSSKFFCNFLMEEETKSDIPQGNDVPLETSQKNDFAVPLGPASKKDASASFAVPSLPSRPKKVETTPKINLENEPEVVKAGEIAGYGLTVIEKVIIIHCEDRCCDRILSSFIVRIYLFEFSFICYLFDMILFLSRYHALFNYF